MGTHILTYIFCLFASCSFAQKNKMLCGDTAFWYKLQYEKDEKLKLPHLIESTDSFHFRFRTDKQIVEIWTSDGIKFGGLITNYINSYEFYDEEKKKKKTSRLFSNQTDLDTVQARNVFSLTKVISEIPTDKSIKGWGQGFDGVEYIFEVVNPLDYCFKTYWTPRAQDSSLIEAKMIQTFVNKLDTLLQLNQRFKDFFSTLEPGSYIGGGPMITVKLTPKQIEYFQKIQPYTDYMNSVKDTLNNYLSDTLTKLFATYGKLDCYDEFFLKFSRANKLVKITTNSELTDKEDKRKFAACKQKIWDIFKKIKIDFVHSQVDYIKELNFWEGEVTISQ